MHVRTSVGAHARPTAPAAAARPPGRSGPAAPGRSPRRTRPVSFVACAARPRPIRRARSCPCLSRTFRFQSSTALKSSMFGSRSRGQLVTREQVEERASLLSRAAGRGTAPTDPRKQRSRQSSSSGSSFLNAVHRSPHSANSNSSSSYTTVGLTQTRTVFVIWP